MTYSTVHDGSLQAQPLESAQLQVLQRLARRDKVIIGRGGQKQDGLEPDAIKGASRTARIVVGDEKGEKSRGDGESSIG